MAYQQSMRRLFPNNVVSLDCSAVFDGGRINLGGHLRQARHATAPRSWLSWNIDGPSPYTLKAAMRAMFMRGSRVENVILHSDPGSQYTASVQVSAAPAHGLRRSTDATASTGTMPVTDHCGQHPNTIATTAALSASTRNWLQQLIIGCVSAIVGVGIRRAKNVPSPTGTL